MIKKAIICQYCDAGVTHIIDPTNYKNDIIAKEDKLGGKCGNCIDRQTRDMFVRVAPNSDHAKEITKEHATEVFRYNKKGNSPKKADSQYH